MNLKFTPKFAILAILDGWGIAKEGPGNAIELAKKVNMDKLWMSYPHTQLQASGEAVGLPRGEDGNTETGHLNLGAGRIIYQDLQRINMAIADGSFFKNKVLIEAFEHAKKNHSKVHMMGLVGAGGVHSNVEHLYALIHLAKMLKFENVFIHVFTDGRDSPPTSAKTYLRNLQKVMQKENIGKIATIIGRYWAMDRDQRWERTDKAYQALTQGAGRFFKDPEEALDFSYAEGETDEFITPAIITNPDGNPLSLIEDNDSIIFFNFRIDRPRQLTRAFLDKDYPFTNASESQTPQKNYDNKNFKSSSPSKKRLVNLYFVTMTDYGKPVTNLGAIPAFPPEIVDIPISGVFSNLGLRQLKITESEKERFVTFYFNGLREKPYPLEERIIIPSSKVATYDQKPEMKAREITQTVLSKLAFEKYNFVVINYPNPDMVGHTGNIEATISAIEVVDECVGKLADFTLAYEGLLVVTADHGNAEEMLNLETGDIDTEHSTNPVPFIAVAKNLIGKGHGLRSGILADVAPTILSSLNLPVPSSMTGRNLLSDLRLF